jgi:copper chaperone NosL
VRPERWLPLLLLLTACSGSPDTGPKAVKWDRDSCERCRMVLSDRHQAAQVRYLPEGSRYSKVLMFDDIGCALLWLEDKPWKDLPSTEIWVADHRDGRWIDARTAYFVPGLKTPMDYGLGAQTQPVAGALDFAQARTHVLAMEQRFNSHGQHLLEQVREQQSQRQQAESSPLPPIKTEH